MQYKSEHTKTTNLTDPNTIKRCRGRKTRGFNTSFWKPRGWLPAKKLKNSV